MKPGIFIIIFTFLAVWFVKAQNSETVSELKPIPSNVGKFSKRVPNYKLKFDVKLDFVNLPDEKKGIAVMVAVPYREVVFENIGGRETARISIYGRIFTSDKTFDGFFEEKLNFVAEIEELVSGIDKKIALRKMFELPKGKYEIGVIVKDVVTGERGLKIIKFQIG